MSAQPIDFSSIGGKQVKTPVDFSSIGGVQLNSPSNTKPPTPPPSMAVQIGSSALGAMGFPSVDPQTLQDAGEAFGSDVKGILKSAPKQAIKLAVMPVPQMMDTAIEAGKILGGEKPDIIKHYEQQKADFAAGKYGKLSKYYGPVYRALSPIAEQMGLNVAGAEQSAEQGKPGGVLGHAAVPVAAMAATEGAMKGGGALVRAADKAIPSFTRASNKISAIEATHGELPVLTAESAPKAQKIVSNLQVTNSTIPKPLQAFVDRVAGTNQPEIMGMNAQDFAARHPEAYQKMVDQGVVQPNPPLTFKDARLFKTRLNDIIFNKELPRDLKGPMKDFVDSLSKEIGHTANEAGFGKEYADFNREYSNASKIMRVANSAGSSVGASVGAILGYELGRATGVPHLPWVMGGVGYGMGKPVVGGITRSILERTPRDIRPPLPPVENSAAGVNLSRRVMPDIANRSRQVDNIMALAKEGTLSPGEADRQIRMLGGSTKIRKPEPPR